MALLCIFNFIAKTVSLVVPLYDLKATAYINVSMLQSSINCEECFKGEIINFNYILKNVFI